MATHQFRMAYADYDVPAERGPEFCGQLLDDLLDHQPSVQWQRVTDLGGGRFYAALTVDGDERHAAAVLADAMTKARTRLRATEPTT